MSCTQQRLVSLEALIEPPSAHVEEPLDYPRLFIHAYEKMKYNISLSFEFYSVIEDFDPGVDPDDSANEDGPQFDDFTQSKRLRENINYHFKQHLLPAFRDGILSLHPLCDHPSYKDDPASIFKTAFNTTMQLIEILNEMISLVILIWKPHMGLVQDNCYGRLVEMCDSIELLDNPPWRKLQSETASLSMASENLLSTLEQHLVHGINLTDIKDGLISTLLSIDNFSKHVSESDFTYYQSELAEREGGLRDKLKEINNLINVLNGPVTRSKTNYLRTLNACPAVIKLSAMFVREFRKIGNPVWKMNLANHEVIFEEIHELHQYATNLDRTLSDTNEISLAYYSLFVRPPTNKLLQILNLLFESYINLRPREVIQFRSWCIMWAGQFDVAVRNYLNAYNVLNHERIPYCVRGETPHLNLAWFFDT